jgi:hypothetical protein
LANRHPDHTTIARFRERHERALAALFGQVLELCAQAGLADVALLAVDGTRVHANASERAMRDYKQLAEEALQEAAQVDPAEDERFGNRRGDELPAELGTAQGRKEWLEAARRRLDDERERAARPIRQPRPARVREAKRRLEEELSTQLVRTTPTRPAAPKAEEGRPPVRFAAEALHAARAARRPHQCHRPRLADDQDAARVLAGLQRPGRNRAIDRFRRPGRAAVRAE